jgi:hypothetical protein
MARIAEIIDNTHYLKYHRAIDNYFFMVHEGMDHVYRGINQGYDEFMREWRRLITDRRNRLFNDRSKIRWDMVDLSNGIFNKKLKG